MSRRKKSADAHGSLRTGVMHAYAEVNGPLYDSLLDDPRQDRPVLAPLEGPLSHVESGLAAPYRA